MDEYDAFLLGKAPRFIASGIEPGPIHPALYDFQSLATAWCIRQGRAALFLDTGLGKTLCELEFCRQTAEATNGYALLFTELAVARQIEREAVKFGFDARVVRDQSEVRPGTNICNYDRLDKLDPTMFGSVTLDESGIIQNFMGKTTRALITAFADTPFRLAATATPAPNDHVELGTHAEFLGVMPQSDMLIRWFINDSSDTGTWRLKGHAVESFWDWVSSWAVMAERPEDLGFDGSRFTLPPLNIHRHKAIGNVKPAEGLLFAGDVSATNIHAVKRETSAARADVVSDLVAADPDHSWVIWCDTDDESAALISRIPDAIEVRGSLSPEKKEERFVRFAEHGGRMITKPKIAAHGMNWQHADRMAFVGRTFSYKAWYQAVRRCWRFGQLWPVDVHIVVAEGEDQIGRVIARKAGAHAEMKRAMVAASRRNFMRSSEVRVKYNPTYKGRLPTWLQSYAA